MLPHKLGNLGGSGRVLPLKSQNSNPPSMVPDCYLQSDEGLTEKKNRPRIEFYINKIGKE